ncbi:MAG: ATP-binding protein [Promethearchaeota archaeon]
MTEDVFRRLQKHFDQFPIGFPATESSVEIRLLKRLFTPEEAEVASLLKFGHFGSARDFESLDSIYERVKHSIEDIEKLLDNMARKGAIMGVTKDGVKSYANALLILGIYEFQVNKLTKGFIEDLNQYLQEAWGPENSKIETPQMRIIPIGVDINLGKKIAKFDDIKNLFEKEQGPFVIINCVCRQKQDLLNEPCQMTQRREVCMGFGDLARMYIEQGWDREINKDEALEFLIKNEQEGLIFQPGNSQRMDFVCSCCYCCCGGIAGLKKLPNPADFATSNYYAEIDEDLCTGCGNCINRCQMDAITLVNNISSIELKRCIGCGNCTLECLSDAITLRKKEQQNIPPLNVEDLIENIWQEKKKVK